MTTDDAAVDAERTGRLADSHTEILFADARLIARIHMTSSASSVRLSCSVWETLSSKRLQVQKSREVKPLEATVIINYVLPAQYSNTLRMNKTADFIINITA